MKNGMLLLSAMADGKTQNERRFGEPFKGPDEQFRTSCESCPISARDQSRLHRFGKKVKPGSVLGYALIAV